MAHSRRAFAPCRAVRAAVPAAAPIPALALLLLLVGAWAVTVGPAPAAAARASEPATPEAGPSGSYSPSGTPVKGASDAAGGPLLPQPGLYQDVLESGSDSVSDPGSTKYYQITLHRGDHAYVSATLITPQQPTNNTQLGLQVTLTALNQNSGCSIGDYPTSESEVGNLVAPLSTVVATGEVGGPDWDSDCPTSGTFVVAVQRSGDAYSANPLPLEIGFHLEPTTVSGGVPSIASPASAVSLSAGTAAVQPLTAGDSFDDAPDIATGRYSGTITSGQTRYFRVPLTWGQRVAFLATARGVQQGGAWASAALFNPVRQQLRFEDGLDTEAVSDFGDLTPSQGLNGSSYVGVRYYNRNSDNDEISPYSIAGDYYLAISLGYPDNGKPISVPYSLLVNVVGTVEAAPSYAVSGPPAAGGASGGGSGSDAVMWVILGVVAAAVIAVAVVIVRRRPAHAAGRPTSAGPGPAGGRPAAPRGSGHAPTIGIPVTRPAPAAPPTSRPDRPDRPGPPGPPGRNGPPPASGPRPSGPPSGPVSGPPAGPSSGPSSGPPSGPQSGPPRR